jgi:23S rRNA (adenine2030-N6)-methyltransferase
MNYRHSYHAGNFADVLKHAILCWTIAYLQQKEAPLCFVDTHAGCGVYDLSGPEALKTSEAKDGVLRLLDRPDVPAVLKPYLDLVRRQGGMAYPGSPALMKAMARKSDRLVLCELHPEEASRLREAMGPSRSIQVHEDDGYRRLKSLVPPAERRGLVLIDPPFEQPEELLQLSSAFIAAHRKWPTGVYLLWFPIKDHGMLERFVAELKSSLITKLSLVTLDVGRAEGLSKTGLVLANAPYTLEADWAPALDWLAKTLAQGARATGRIEQLS